MTALPKRKLTAEEYLVIERDAEFKSDFYDGVMYSMAGASIEHNRVKENLARELGNRLVDGPCECLSSDQRVLINRTGLYTYPDIVVVCDPIERSRNDANTIVNPRIIFEVLSPSTERYDRDVKLRHYGQIESLQEYILVSQHEPQIHRLVRQADGTWSLKVFHGIEETFSLTSLPIEIPLAKVYRNITFPEVAPPRGDTP